MVEMLEQTKGDLIAVHAEGTVEKADYDKVIPLMEKAIEQHGKIRIYLEVGDLDFFGARALWEEVKADIKYYNNMRKAAIVGNASWKLMATNVLDKRMPLEAKYFSFEEKDEARKWIGF
jgi:hypothetical protein